MTKEHDNPDWDLHKNKRFHWTQEVPSEVRQIWDTFTNSQKYALMQWATEVAADKESDYWDAIERSERDTDC